jgi:hypothetical protein
MVESPPPMMRHEEIKVENSDKISSTKTVDVLTSCSTQNVSLSSAGSFVEQSVRRTILISATEVHRAVDLISDLVSILYIFLFSRNLLH